MESRIHVDFVGSKKCKGRTFRIVFFAGVGVEAYLWFGLIFNFRTRERVMLCEASSMASFSTLGSGGT